MKILGRAALRASLALLCVGSLVGSPPGALGLTQTTLGLDRTTNPNFWTLYQSGNVGQQIPIGTIDPNTLIFNPRTGYAPVSHVANAAALASTFAPYLTNTIIRDDIGYAYTTTHTNCAIPGGDNWWQIQTPAGCFQADISHGAPIEMWGGSKDDVTLNQIPMNLALQALASVGGGPLFFGATAAGQCYKFTSGVADNLASVQLIGDAGGSCIDRAFAAGTLFLQGSTTASGILSKAIQNLTFKHSVTATSGTDIQFIGTRGATATNITCLKGSYYCISIDNSVLTTVTNIQDSAEGQAAIAIGCNYAGVAANIAIVGGNVNYQHRSSVEGCNFSGVTFEAGFNADFNNHGFWAHPNTGQYANSLSTKTGVYFDSSYNEGVLFDLTGGGSAGENLMSPETWIVSCGATVAAQSTNNVTGDPLLVPFTPGSSIPCFRVVASLTAASGAGSAVHNIFKAFVFNAAAEGVVANGGRWNDYGGTSLSNCLAYAPTDGLCSGFKAKAGTTDFTWDGRLGGGSSLGGPNDDAYGAVIEAGASSRYRLTGDARGNQTGAVFDGGTGVDRDLSGLLGFTGYLYTPTISALTGTITTASATGRWTKNGSAVTIHDSLAVTTNGSGAGYAAMSLPMSADATGTTICSARDPTTGALYGALIQSSGNKVILQTGTGYPTSATSWGADVTCVYNAAQ